MKKREILLKDVPSHKKVPNTLFTIDYFHKKVIDSKCSFLTHFHSDHYYGLTKNFDSKIYSSETTSNLLNSVLKIKNEFLCPLEMFKVYFIENCKVLCFEANHCPGAVCFIFGVGEKVFLHTGDFRFDKSVHLKLNTVIADFGMRDFEQNKENLKNEEKNIIARDDSRTNKGKNVIIENNSRIIEGKNINTRDDSRTNEEKNILLKNNSRTNKGNTFSIKNQNKMPQSNTYDIVFLDNTYENYHNFVPQLSVIHSLIEDIINLLYPKNKLAPIPTKFIFSSYFIGKEKLFLSIAYFFQFKINVQLRKYKAIECFSEYTRNNLIQYVLSIYDKLIKRIKIPFLFSFKANPFHLSKEERILPFDLITHSEEAEIDILPPNYINKKKIEELYGSQKNNFKKIFIICGTGWSKKRRFINFCKENTIIKNGIEIVQYPYSEHSSSEEILQFRKFIDCLKIVPTVKLNEKGFD